MIDNTDIKTAPLWQQGSRYDRCPPNLRSLTHSITAMGGNGLPLFQDSEHDY